MVNNVDLYGLCFVDCFALLGNFLPNNVINSPVFEDKELSVPDKFLAVTDRALSLYVLKSLRNGMRRIAFDKDRVIDLFTAVLLSSTDVTSIISDGASAA